jgi:hypothetical protein
VFLIVALFSLSLSKNISKSKEMIVSTMQKNNIRNQALKIINIAGK